VLSTTSVFVLIIATEFWDGIVAYISACVGFMTNEEAGKLYCATISPKAAWALGAQAKQKCNAECFWGDIAQKKRQPGNQRFFHTSGLK
jgi:hypothetical protein